MATTVNFQQGTLNDKWRIQFVGKNPQGQIQPVNSYYIASANGAAIAWTDVSPAGSTSPTFEFSNGAFWTGIKSVFFRCKNADGVSLPDTQVDFTSEPPAPATTVETIVTDI